MLKSLTAVGAVLLVGAGVFTSVPAQAADPTCEGRPATIVVPTGQVQPVLGTEGDDVIYVTRSADVDALGGNDVICGGGGNWRGGAGDDTLVGGGSLLGGAGNDVLRGGPENQSIGGQEGNDEIWGGGGGGNIEPGAGDDVIHGLPDEVLQVGAATGTTTVDAGSRTANGPDGRDTWTGSPMLSGGFASGDIVYFGTDGPDSFSGGHGHDRIYGRGGDDTLSGFVHVEINGGPGDDLVTTWYGGTVKAGPGDDRISNYMETDDEFTTVVERYDLAGGAGDDVIHPTSVTNAGDPSSSYGPSWDWRGTVRGGSGVDRIDFARAFVAVNANLATGKATWDYGRMRMAGVEALWGTRANDVLRGDSRANVLRGGAGKDRAYGGPGRDSCRAEVRRSCERR